MTVEDGAKYLFVSRPFIRRLLAAGELLEVLPRSPSGEPDIDAASVQAYRIKADAAAQAWQDSQAEDDESPGL